MLAVRDDAASVDVELAAGRLCCPSCSGSLAPWGWARPRRLRTRTGVRRLRPRRTRCRTCHATHVLVPTSTLLRRSATADLIGAALLAKRGGRGHRRIAELLGVPAATVRGWLRRFTARAEHIRGMATAWANWLYATVGPIIPRGSPFDDALEALSAAVGVITRTLGPARSPWHAVGALTGTLLLATADLPTV